jgi:transcriptional regulator GlxA family with amidase domain
LSAQAPIEVLFVILPDTLLLDWAGPAEAFRIANRLCITQKRPSPFVVKFVGPQRSATSSVKAVISNLEPLPKQLAKPTWIVLSGSTSDSTAWDPIANRKAVEWLQRLEPVQDEIHLITICAGALLAARAGLMQQYSATTHHEHLDDLARLAPTCQVVSNRVFVKDGPIYSSAGVTTGIDLALHLISNVCGAAIAARVAQTMVVGVRRGAHDPELSPLLAHRSHLHPAIHRVQDAVSERPTLKWSVARMAQVSHTSTRHLTRVFLEHTGVTPLQYLRSIRLHLAEMSLRSGHSVTRAAELAGFRSDTQLRRAWRDLGKMGTPSQTVQVSEL